MNSSGCCGEEGVGAKPHSEPGRGCQVKRAGVPPSFIRPFTFRKDNKLMIEFNEAIFYLNKSVEQRLSLPQIFEYTGLVQGCKI